MNASTTDRIHELWDELADFDAARADDALDHLLASLCRLVDAQNAMWIGAVRLPDIVPGDPVHGWRVRCFRHLHPAAVLTDATKAQIKNLERGSVDETTVRNVALAGSFRVNRAEDLVSGWLESDHCARYFKPLGRVDVIWAGMPINNDAESYFGVFRHEGHPRFTAEECGRVGAALRGLKWFCRRQMLSHGLTMANSPLTAAEREILSGLLTGQSEKQIAAALGKSYHTTHEYVSGIFRKFDVNNRAALMALWLGKAR